jgi:hypothetical protein
MLAEEIGVGRPTVQRVWKEHSLKPHLLRPFKLSNDPKFAESGRHRRALAVGIGVAGLFLTGVIAGIAMRAAIDDRDTG